MINQNIKTTRPERMPRPERPPRPERKKPQTKIPEPQVKPLAEIKPEKKPKRPFIWNPAEHFDERRQGTTRRPY